MREGRQGCGERQDLVPEGPQRGWDNAQGRRDRDLEELDLQDFEYLRQTLIEHPVCAASCKGHWRCSEALLSSS